MARQVFTEGLADTVHPVRTRRVRGIDGFALAVKPGDVVGTGKHHAFDAVRSRRFVQVVNTQNIGLKNRPKWSFDGYAAEMHDGINPLHHGIDRLCIGQIGQHHFLVCASGAEVKPIREPQHLAVRLETLAQGLAQAASSASEQEGCLGFDRYGLTHFWKFFSDRWTSWR